MKRPDAFAEPRLIERNYGRETLRQWRPQRGPRSHAMCVAGCQAQGDESAPRLLLRPEPFNQNSQQGSSRRAPCRCRWRAAHSTAPAWVATGPQAVGTR